MPPRLIFPVPDWRALAAVVPSVSPASCVHAHVAGEPGLVFTPVGVGVSPADAFHAHVAGEPALAFVPAVVNLAPAGAFHAHVAGEPGLVFTPLGIAPADAFHAHVAGEPGLTFAPAATATVTALVADTPVVNVGGEVVLTVTIDTPAAPGANQVTISSDGPAYSPALPQTITIPNGETSATITLTGATGYAVGTLTATGVGGIAGTATVAQEVSDVMLGATILPEGVFVELASTPATTAIERRFQLLRSTYAADGTPTLRKMVGYVNRRRPQPGVIDPEVFGGVFSSTPPIDLDNQATLGTVIYPADQVPGATANNSTRADKPTLQIRFLSHFTLERPLGDSETIQVAVLGTDPVWGYHVATMGVRVGDGVTEVEAFQAESVPYNCPVTGLVGEVYEVTVDLSSFDDGDILTVAADAYSWHGNVQSTDALTADFNIRNGSGTFDILKHEDIKANPVIAFVSDIPAVDPPPLASTDAAAARARPFAHTAAGLRAALEAARVINNARTAAINGCDGTQVYMTYVTTPQTSFPTGGVITDVPVIGSGYSIISDDVAYPNGNTIGAFSPRATGAGGALTPARFGWRVEGFAEYFRPVGINGLVGGPSNMIGTLAGRADGNSVVDHDTPTGVAQYMATTDTCVVFRDVAHLNLQTGSEQTWFNPSVGAREIAHIGCAATFSDNGTSTYYQATTVIGCRFPNGRPGLSVPTDMGMFIDSSELVGSPATGIVLGINVNFILGTIFNRSLLFYTATNGENPVWNISADAQPTAANSVKFPGCTLIAQVEGRVNAFYVDASGDTRVQLFSGFGPGTIMANRWAYKDDRGGTATSDTADEMLVRQRGGAMMDQGIGMDGNWFAVSWTGTEQRVKSVGYGSTPLPTIGSFADPGFVALDRGSVGVAADPASDVRLRSDGAAVGGVQFLNGEAPFRWDAYGNAPVAGTPGYRHDLEAV